MMNGLTLTGGMCQGLLDNWGYPVYWEGATEMSENLHKIWILYAPA